MHDDLVEPAHVEHIVLVAIQDAAIALGIESQAILANALSEHLAVGIRAATHSALFEAVHLAFQAAHAFITNLLGVVGVLWLAVLNCVGGTGCRPRLAWLAGRALSTIAR